MKTYYRIIKEPYDQLWHAYYLHGDKGTYDRVNFEEMFEISKKLINVKPLANDINQLGERLRVMFFGDEKGLGCYENFDVLEDVKQLPDKLDIDENVYHSYAKNNIVMNYYWDGDGYLEFILPNNGTRIYNDDCKKTHNWKNL